MEKEYFQPRKFPEKKEITITLNMGTVFKLLRGVFVLLLVGGVFMLGRYSVDWKMPSFDFGSTGATTVGEKAAAEETAPPAPETTTEAAAAEPVPEAAAPETNVEGTVPATDENVVNTYNNVQLTLDDVVYTWDAEGASGKITDIAYSIINGESGTIKPSYFIMTVEKYDDKERRFNMDTRGRTIPAGETSKRKIEVTSGFTYSKAQLGDLSAVAITVALFDAGDKQVGTAVGNFKLER